jgi:hypothetical protein
MTDGLFSLPLLHYGGFRSNIPAELPPEQADNCSIFNRFMHRKIKNLLAMQGQNLVNVLLRFAIGCPRPLSLSSVAQIQGQKAYGPVQTGVGGRLWPIDLYGLAATPRACAGSLWGGFQATQV